MAHNLHKNSVKEIDVLTKNVVSQMTNGWKFPRKNLTKCYRKHQDFHQLNHNLHTASTYHQFQKVLRNLLKKYLVTKVLRSQSKFLLLSLRGGFFNYLLDYLTPAQNIRLVIGNNGWCIFYHNFDIVFKSQAMF